MNRRIRTRRLEAGDLDAYFDIRVQAFGLPSTDRDAWKHLVALSPEAVGIGVFEGTKLLGGLRVLPVGQFLMGRSVPMGALAAIVVRPEARGQGVARELVGASLDWMRDHDIAVSSLHPASTRVYRSMGWEHAGRAGWATIAARSLAGIPVETDTPVMRLGDPDRDAIRACFAVEAAARHGAVDRSTSWWNALDAAAPETGSFAYGIEATSGLSGYVRYTQLPEAGPHYGVRVEDFVAHDLETAALLWRFLGSHASQVPTVTIPAGAVRGLLLLLDEQDVEFVEVNRWMHRIVDLPAMMAARGFPSSVAGSVAVRVSDPWGRGVSGTWKLEVADGRGSAVAADEADVAIDVGALSALAVGRVAVGDLHRVGRVSGSPDASEQLGALLVAPRPVMTDEF